MTYVMTEACVDCKYTDCALVSPVEAFHETPDRLLINSDNCIDCDACVPECPVEAIYPNVNVPEEYRDRIRINAEEAGSIRSSARRSLRFLAQAAQGRKNSERIDG